MEKNDMLTPTVAIGIPVGWAAVSATCLGLFAGTMAWYFAWSSPFVVFMFTWTGSFPVAWFLGLRTWRGFIPRLEQITRIDIDGNGAIGKNAYGQEVTKIDWTEDNGKTGKFLELPTNPEQSKAVAMHVLRGGQFTHGALVGRGKMFTRSEFEGLRDYLTKEGFMRWVNPHATNQGTVLTAKGEALFRGILSQRQ
jgi:hypothetical protein